ncbi:hypothetical protein [Alicyclobacillus macrosporangiidus]|uniref:phosphorylase family protein n=1 Tax=Alicyclobacillus macrosporangiidus TaxID=392015 RepID=UPI0009451F6A
MFSRPYLPPETTVHASEQLRKLLMQCADSLGYSTVTGRHWTTDAIYREHIDEINRHRNSGVLGVDMETSAMYALGMVRGVDVANVLAVSDELWHDWNPAFGSERLDKALDRACEIVLTAVSRVS